MQRPLGLPEAILAAFVAFGYGINHQAAAKETVYVEKKVEVPRIPGNLEPVYPSDLPGTPSIFYDKSRLYRIRLSCKSASMEPTFGCNDVVLAYL